MTDEGGCLCGGVRYALDRAAVVMASHCHCRDCQRCTGSGQATFVAVPEGGFERSSGDVGSFAVTGESGGSVERFFCRNCGSQLYSRVSIMPGILFVKAGSLDDGSWVEPSSAYWTTSAQPWAPPAGGVQLHERNPG